MKPRHETPDHIAGKRLLADFWQARGYRSMYEEGRADVVAFRIRDGRGRIVASEYERTSKNLVRNVRRDLAGGCCAVLVAVPNAKIQSAIRRKLQREFPRHIWTKVSVVLLERITSRTPPH